MKSKKQNLCIKIFLRATSGDMKILRHFKCRIFLVLLLCVMFLLILTINLTSSFSFTFTVVSRADMRFHPESKTFARRLILPVNSSPHKAVYIPLIRDVYIPGYDESHSELCPSLGAELDLVIMVSSAPSHAAARQAVRQTWGRYAARSDITIAFFLGAIPEELRDDIEIENNIFEDLVIGRYVDSYSNLTLKTLSMLEWFDTYCYHAPKLVKTDDDIFINIPNLLEFVNNHTDAKKTIWGRLIKNHVPHRLKASKYYLAPIEYAEEVFPDYICGNAYVVTNDCVKHLLEATPYYPYLKLEDVFFTGVLAEQLGINRVHNNWFYHKTAKPDPYTIKSGISLHLSHYQELFDVWRQFLRVMHEDKSNDNT